VASDWIDADAISLELEDCDVDAQPVAQQTLRFELALYSAAPGGVLTLDLEYALDVWDPAVIAERLNAVAYVLAAGARDPDRPLRELDFSQPAVPLA
jgi:hypothetical protein